MNFLSPRATIVLKHTALIICLFFTTHKLHAQDYLISFAGTVENRIIDSVRVENLTKGTSIVLLGSDVLRLKSVESANNQISRENIGNLRIYPNPLIENSTIEFDALFSGRSNIEIYEISGRKVFSAQKNLSAGKYYFTLNGLTRGVYILKINSQKYLYTGKLLSNKTSKSEASISLNGFSEYSDREPISKSALSEVEMQYKIGDYLKFTAISENIKSVIFCVPTQSETIKFDFPSNIDIDGNAFSITQIGNQIWMAENLKVSKYNDGIDIPNLANRKEWISSTIGGYCNYNDKVENGNIYGKLYNWYAVNTNKLCPSGWHVPSDDEWNALQKHLASNGYSIDKYGKKIAKSLATAYGWDYTIWDGSVGKDDYPEIQNSTGFSALPGGNRTSDGDFEGTGFFGVWWSSTIAQKNKQDTTAYMRDMDCSESEVGKYGFDLQVGASVRCIKNAILPSLCTDTISELSSNSAICGGTIIFDGNTKLTACGVCWSKNQNPTIENNITTDNLEENRFISSITGLKEGTKYYLRAYATNSEGTAYGNEIFFTPGQSIKSPTVTTSAVRSYIPTTASGGGNISSDGGAPIIEKGVCWSTNINPTVTDNKTINGTGTGSFTSDIIGLSENRTTYYVRAYATNIAGTAYGNEISFISRQKIYIPTVTTSMVTNITQTTASSGGNVTYDGGATVTERGLCWNIRPNPTTAKNRIPYSSYSGVFKGDIYPLQANTTYYLRAYAINNQGIAYGNEVVFTTNQIITLPVVTTNGFSNISQTSATSGGNISSDGGAPITERGVCWSMDKNPTTEKRKSSDGIGSGNFTSNIVGLMAGTKYYLRAYATNSAGTAYGNEIFFVPGNKTHSPSVTTTEVTNISKTSATCAGNISSDGGASVTEKGICWSTSQNPTIENRKVTQGTGVGSISCNLTELTAGTTYYVKAFATNSNGTVYGNEVRFKTLHEQVADVDGNVYNTITVGSQVWLAENLKTTKFNDGTSIPLVTANDTWDSLTTPAYCWFDNDPWYKEKYGALYNWYTVGTAMLCPAGWHVATDDDWTKLEYYLIKNGFNYDGTKIYNKVAKSLASTTDWRFTNGFGYIGVDPENNNSVGFSAWPSGNLTSDGIFSGFGESCYWWSPQEYTQYNIMYRRLRYNSEKIEAFTSNKQFGYSVRCIKD